MSSSSPLFIPSSSEERWIRTITLNYTIDLKDPPCVFQVPQSIRNTKPEAYTPQVVGLGPYHHFRPEVQQMESKKRDAARKHINREEFKDFIKFVNEMTKNETAKEFETTIRSSYDRYLDLDAATLSWIIVVDGIFLLHVVNNCLDKKREKKVDPEIERLVPDILNNCLDKKRERKIDPEIERLVPDILMLENQIPLELLRKFQKALRRSITEATDIDLFNKFTNFCREHSPLKLLEEPELQDGFFEKHMLHYMYQLIVNNYDEKSGASASSVSRTSDQESSPEEPGHECSASASASSASRTSDQKSSQEEPRHGCSANLGVLASQVKDTFRQVKELIAPQAKDVLTGVEDSVSSGYQRLRSSGVNVSNNIEKTGKFLQKLKKINPNLFGESNIQPGVEEIDVPSVSQLHRIAKIKFARTDGGIRNLDMDPKSNTLYLPVITLRANSEVVLRNLVAYEVASTKLGSTLELTEYLDLMCGIVDTKNDVKLLKELKIIEGDLPEDEIVALFNGINKSTERPGEKTRVQKIVEDMNKKFSEIGIVKAYNSLKKFLARLRDLLTQLFPLLVLILLTLQYVCDIRGCSSRRLGYATVGWDSSFGDGSSLSLDSQANYLMVPRKMLRYSN